MMPLGLLGQIYVVCASIGVIFVFANVLLGQIDGGGDDGPTGDGDSDGGPGDAEGDSGSSFGSDGDGDNTSGRVITAGRGNSAGTGFGGFLLGLLSPMTISLYLTIFGATGLVCLYYAASSGYLTLIPAIVVSLIVGGIYKNMIRWMMRNLHSSSHTKQSDIIGLLAEVNTPIQGERTGEITFVVHSKRLNSSAKSATPGVDFKRGSKVVIVESKDHILLVEPCPDLEDQFVSR